VYDVYLLVTLLSLLLILLNPTRYKAAGSF